MTPDEQQLSDGQKEKIWAVIHSKTDEDDKDPNLVIRDDYGGDENAYLLAMARHHQIEL